MDALDALAATFPAGTLSGAPKIRAMEIIDELEPARARPLRRRPSATSTSAATWTLHHHPHLVIADGQAYVQAGAGIVADSDPERETRRPRPRRGRCSRPCACAGDLCPMRSCSSTTTTPSPTTSSSTWASWGPRSGASATTSSPSTEALAQPPDRIVISPGPGNPDQAGISLELIRALARRDRRSSGSASATRPSAGLRRQGGARARAHARQDLGDPPRRPRPLRGLPEPFTATRYHSLVVARGRLPDCLEVRPGPTDGEIMGLRHRTPPPRGRAVPPRDHPDHRRARTCCGTSSPSSEDAAPGHASCAASASREAEACAAMDTIMDGAATPAQIGALLAALACGARPRTRSSGFARAMRARACRSCAADAVDTCGTGGDGAGTFNISTVASWWWPRCGVTVAKHGNRSASGSCGSADVLEALGVTIDAPLEAVQRCLDEIGLGLPLRARLPRLDPPRGGPAPRAGRAHHLQPARPPHQPGAARGAGDGGAPAGAAGLRRPLPRPPGRAARLGGPRRRASTS